MAAGEDPHGVLARGLAIRWSEIDGWRERETLRADRADLDPDREVVFASSWMRATSET